MCRVITSAGARARRERQREAGLCLNCGEPRGDNGTKTRCRNCADTQTAYARERRERLIQERLCVRCAGPRGEGGTKDLCRACAKLTARGVTVWRDHRRDAGLCEECGEPRGKEGTGTRCRSCADKQKVRARDRRKHRREAGLCAYCGEPRGDDSAGDRCPLCVDKHAGRRRERHQHLVEEGLCPKHLRPMRMLERCPACLYGAGAQISGFSFIGLLPPPTSGDRLEACVRCESCSRFYHEDFYSRPRLSADLKLRDEHVGADGAGLWLLFSCEDEHGRVPIEYEACSMPDDKCVGLARREHAFDSLRRHRTGERLSGACKAHFQDRERLREVVAARLRQSASGNGDGQKKERAQKRNPGHQPGELVLDRVRLKSDFEEIVKKLREAMPQHRILRRVITEEYNRRGESIHETTVTKRVQLIYGDGVTVADGVARVLDAD
jgi:hypothetical protein